MKDVNVRLAALYSIRSLKRQLNLIYFLFFHKVEYRVSLPLCLTEVAYNFLRQRRGRHIRCYLDKNNQMNCRSLDGQLHLNTYWVQNLALNLLFHVYVYNR